MKRKDFTDLKAKEIKELKKLISEKKLIADKTKAAISGGKEKNLKAFKNLRREIAKILTLIREKEILESLQPKEVKEEKK